jgi:hypothetical protein
VVDKVIVDRFAGVLKKGQGLLTEHIEHGRFSDAKWVKAGPYAEWQAQSLTVLSVVFGADHPYTQRFENVTSTKQSGLSADVPWVEAGLGILSAAAEDFGHGHTWTFKEIVHAEVFDDYLEMASHLVNNGGYKDAAAVIAGSTLEEHLRQLCRRNNIATHVPGKSGMDPRKTPVLNDDLHKHTIYPQNEWRAVQSWLDIRNDAAHGDYSKYDHRQVAQMIDGIRGFFARHSA